MNRARNGTTDELSRNLLAFVAAFLVFVCLLVALSSCGNDDLIFPGDIPFTPTSEPTDTPEPDA